jgi:coatomer subunit beta'
LNVTSFSLLLSVLEYQTAVMRRDFVTADRVLPIIPKEHRTRVAHFLEKQGFKQQALQVSTDPEHLFDLALQIGDLDTALKLARESDAPQKWSQLAEVATQKNKLDLVQECLTKANDFGGLLLLATSAGDSQMLRNIGENGVKQLKYNISFLSMFLLGDLDQCLEILIQTNRIPEAAFFARTYLPNKITYVLDLWRQELGKVNEKADKVAQSLADPEQYENLFPGFQLTVKTQQYLEAERVTHISARQAPQVSNSFFIFSLLKM